MIKVARKQLHNQGGSADPYEMFHLTQDERDIIIAPCVETSAGLLSKKRAALLTTRDTTTGSVGQRGIPINEGGSIYTFPICVLINTWKKFQGNTSW